MDSNTHSTARPEGLPALAATLQALAAQDPTSCSAGVRVDRVRELGQLVDQLVGHWLAELAGVDAAGAAGAEAGVPAGSTAGWLRARLRLSAGAASSAVRTARALFGGPLTQTGQALLAGELTPAHARVVAAGTQDLPTQVTAEAEPVLVEAARRLDPGRLRRAVEHLRLVADPEGAAGQAERRHGRRGLWLSPTLDGMVGVDGLLEAEAGQTLLAALEPLARPATAHDDRSGGQRRADALTELARRALEGGRLPQTGGVRPQLTVIVDLDSLTGGSGAGAVGGAIDGGVLEPEACRRLACDGAVTRVLVTRHPTPHHAIESPGGHDHHGNSDPDGHDPGPSEDPTGHPGRGAPASPGSLTARLRAAAVLLPLVLGGAPCQPLDLGRTTRVVSPGQRTALAVRDGGCVFPDCDRPLEWCEAHHLWHWLDGGPTDLANLALLCRAHHRTVHEGGWQLIRGPDGRLTATPPQRSRRRQPAAA